MKDCNQLIPTILEKTQTSSDATTTKAGQKDFTKSIEELEAISDAIVEIFAQFELVYHNQYNKAFPTKDKEDYAKKLWFNHLRDYRATHILRATDQAIRSSEYLPTINSVLKHIKHDDTLPSAFDAYRECCMASSPKAEYNWSHPIVYWSGLACGWYFLNHNSEKAAFARFKEKYQQLCQQLAQGQQFPAPTLVIAAPNIAYQAPELPSEKPEDTLQKLHNMLRSS